MRKALAGAVVLLSLLTSFALFALPAGAVEQAVTARDFAFDPATKNVNVGDTIRFTNTSTTTTHNVTFETPSNTNLGDMSPGGSVVSPAFPTAGTFTYFCRFHVAQGMRGTVIVGSGTVSTTGTRTITVSPTSVAPGGTFTVSGTGFPPGTTLDLLVNNVRLESTLTDANGNFSKPVTLPAGAGPPGSYPVVARAQTDQSISATTAVQITAATTVTTVTPGSVTATTLATGTTLPSSLPSSAPPPGASGTTYTGTARTGRNEHLMMVVAAIALALGTLLVMVTPKPGRHAKKAFNLF